MAQVNKATASTNSRLASIENAVSKEVECRKNAEGLARAKAEQEMHTKACEHALLRSCIRVLAAIVR